MTATVGYSPYGESIARSGSFNSDFGFAQYYLHQRSGLNLTRFRAYNSKLGSWLSRDPSSGSQGNKYGYALNNPVCFSDPSGLKESCCIYDKEPERLARDNIRINSWFTSAMAQVRAGTSPWSGRYAGQGERTRVGNIIDRTFKDLVGSDPSLSHLTVPGNFQKGPDVQSGCDDIWWEVTSRESWPAHQARFTAQGYSLTGRAPVGMLYSLFTDKGYEVPEVLWDLVPDPRWMY